MGNKVKEQTFKDREKAKCHEQRWSREEETEGNLSGRCFNILEEWKGEGKRAREINRRMDDRRSEIEGEETNEVICGLVMVSGMRWRLDTNTWVKRRERRRRRRKKERRKEGGKDRKKSSCT